MSNLHSIGAKYRTDKAIRHQYLDIYEKYFDGLKDKPIKLLEIGFKEGHSAKMWEEYFSNDGAQFYSIDIRPRAKSTSKTKLLILDQSNRDNLKTLEPLGKFDIIIDDGSHIVDHQQISLGCLFPYVKDGGLYIIEDLFLAGVNPKSYNPSGTMKTTSVLANKLKDKEKIESDFMLGSEIEYIENNINACHVEKGRKSEIAFIFKK